MKRAAILATVIIIISCKGALAVSFDFGDLIKEGLGVDIDALGMGSVFSGGGVDDILCPGNGLDLGGFTFPDLSLQVGICKVGLDLDLEKAVRDYGPKSEICRYLPSSTPARMSDKMSVLTGGEDINVGAHASTNVFDKNIYSLSSQQLGQITKDCGNTDKSLPNDKLKTDEEVFEATKLIIASQSPDRQTAAMHTAEVREIAKERCVDAQNFEGCLKSVLASTIDQSSTEKREAIKKITASKMTAEEDAQMPFQSFIPESESEIESLPDIDKKGARRLVQRMIAIKTERYSIRNAIAKTEENLFEAEQLQVATASIPIIREKLAKAAIAVEDALKDLP